MAREITWPPRVKPFYILTVRAVTVRLVWNETILITNSVVVVINICFSPANIDRITAKIMKSNIQKILNSYRLIIVVISTAIDENPRYELTFLGWGGGVSTIY